MANFNEIRILEGGDVFVLMEEKEKKFIITDLETANTLADFEATNEWAGNAEDVFINDLETYVNELINMFGYTQIEED